MNNMWSAFLDHVEQARHDLGDPEIVWYRGHSNISWPLVPSLMRVSEGLEKEQFLFHAYKKSAARLQERRDNDWETLFDMQHYGIPTRLLDWSEVLGVSIAFALLGNYQRDESDACVYVLNPVSLNKRSGLDDIVNVPDDANFVYRSIYWERKPFAAMYPIAINPPFQNARMLAQKGAFTIHSNNPQPLEEQCPESVRKIPLPNNAKEGARQFLEYANLNEYSIYPDIVGMASHIRKLAFGW